MVPSTLNELLSLGKNDLQNLDLDGTLRMIDNLPETIDRYSGHIAVLVYLDRKAKNGAVVSRSDIDFLPYQCVEVKRDDYGHSIFKQPDEDHCVMIDWKNGQLIGMGTLRYSDAIDWTENNE